MRVEFAFFDSDSLLSRDEIHVGSIETSETLSLFQADHLLKLDSADVTLSNFPGYVDLKKVTLDIPVHESKDWESIDLGRYTLAFWCRLDA